MAKQREYSFDLLRVVAMFMVVMIHVSNVYSRDFGLISNSSFFVSLIFNTVSRLSVPIFFMISGALLLNRKFELKKYLNRIKKFIIIIIVWDIIYLIWEYLYLGITYDKLYMLLKEPYRAHLWFLYTILLLYIIQPILRAILNKMNKEAKIILLSTWLILSCISITGIINFPHVFSDISYIGFFIMGKYLYDFIKTKDLRKYNLILITIMIFTLGLSIILNYNMSLKNDMFYNHYFGYRTPFIIIPSFIFFILIVSNYRKNTINKEIMQLSELSLGVYLIHGIFLDITKEIFNYMFIHSSLGIPIFSSIIFIFSVISVYYLRKIKLLKEIL